MDYCAVTDKIKRMIEAKDYVSVHSMLTAWHPADIAALSGVLPNDILPVVFRLLPKETAANSFSFMDSETQASLLQAFSDQELDSVTSLLFVNDMVDILEDMPANVVHRILQTVPPEKREQINVILRYPPKSTGSLMTTEFIELKQEMTAADVFHTIRSSGLRKKTIYNSYVTDSSRHLIGVLSVKDLIHHLDTNITVREMMTAEVISARVWEPQEETVSIMKKYGFLALPVTDHENRLVGIITLDDAMAVVENETTEDIEIMAAVTPSEKTYFRTTVLESWKMRVPWLMFLMISSVFTSKILQFFEGKLTANAALIAFIPVIMDTAGNAGGQSSATITRSLSTEEIKIRFPDLFRTVWKETRASVWCGLCLAFANFLKMTAMDNVSWKVSLTVSISICTIVPLADLIGAVLPFGAKKIGLDPAVTASPLITTICDTLSLLVYFGTAVLLLGI